MHPSLFSFGMACVQPSFTAYLLPDLFVIKMQIKLQKRELLVPHIATFLFLIRDTNGIGTFSLLFLIFMFLSFFFLYFSLSSVFLFYDLGSFSPFFYAKYMVHFMMKYYFQISRIVEDLRAVKFSMDSSEEEAGKVMQTLMRQESAQADLEEKTKIEALQIAASRLHITSQRDQLVERRSIKKQIEKNSNSDRRNQMLIYLLNLLKKYGKFIVEEQTENNAIDQHERPFPFPNSFRASLHGQSGELGSCLGYGQHEAQTDVFRRPIPPEEFMCPMSSRLMYDPVIIDSGVTFERMWIQKWFAEGHDTCPQSDRKLAKMSLTPNTAMKELILKWCMKHGIPEPGPCIEPPAFNTWEFSSTSITSLTSSMNDLCLPIDISGISLGSLDNSYSSDSSHYIVRDGLSLTSVKTIDESHRCHDYGDRPETDTKFLSELATHPWKSQCQVVEDVEKDLKGDNQAWHSLSPKNFVEPLIRFLKDACEKNDVKAQRVGSQLFLAFVSKSR